MKNKFSNINILSLIHYINIMNKAMISTKGHLIDPFYKNKSGQILESDGNIYDCTLNQTDIKTNKNKFYIMQIIVDNGSYTVFVRYGRIGEQGRSSYNEYRSKDAAITYFERQFRTKTGNSWAARNKFVKNAGKYFMAEIECVEISEDESNESSSEESSDSNVLDERVEKLVRVITNTTYMQNTLVELEIDTEKMPLGKISRKQIDDAYKILNEINNNLNDKSLLEILSSEYYTLIPNACGRRKPPVINSTALVGKNINLLNELSNMIFDSKTITKTRNKKVDIFKLYQDLNTEIVPLETNDDMYQILIDYLKNSKAPTHNIKYKVLDIFEISRENERQSYDKYSKKLKNKTLLFHGTRVSNLYGIIKNGLLVDPSKLGINVCITGKMFGMGLYFANSCSKSIQYCAYQSSDNIACLFVAEVALGKMLPKKQSDSSLSAKTMPIGYHSTWGLGRSSFTDYDEYDKVRIPQGKLKQLPATSDRSLLYDEFIVYHEEQVNMKYIIVLQIN